MSESYNENLLQVLKLANEMISLADQGDMDRLDRGCGIVYGMLRDAAYKVQEMARQEIASHRSKGNWFEDDRQVKSVLE